LHGAVRLHGLTSSPTPETQVRVACAEAGAAYPIAAATAIAATDARRVFIPFIMIPPSGLESVFSNTNWLEVLQLSYSKFLFRMKHMASAIWSTGS
jgi:hypothetical protein